VCEEIAVAADDMVSECRAGARRKVRRLVVLGLREGGLSAEMSGG
jgi:hypothetical protein